MDSVQQKVQTEVRTQIRDGVTPRSRGRRAFSSHDQRKVAESFPELPGPEAGASYPLVGGVVHPLSEQRLRSPTLQNWRRAAFTQHQGPARRGPARSAKSRNADSRFEAEPLRGRTEKSRRIHARRSGRSRRSLAREAAPAGTLLPRPGRCWCCHRWDRCYRRCQSSFGTSSQNSRTRTRTRAHTQPRRTAAAAEGRIKTGRPMDQPRAAPEEAGGRACACMCVCARVCASVNPPWLPTLEKVVFSFTFLTQPLFS